MTGKTALITGAARRIGAVIARHLHENRFDVALHCNRSGEEARRLADTFNHIRADSCRCVHANLLDLPSCYRVIDETLEWKGRLDALINNASVFYPTLLAEIDEDEWDETVGTNLKAPFFLARRAAGHLEKTRGCIVNITDIHGTRPLKRYAAYSVSKAGLDMLTRSLAKELAPKVRVNAVSPGAISWPPDMEREVKDKILSKVPLGRAGEPMDIARAVYFLIADADYITGQVLAVDGGRSL